MSPVARAAAGSRRAAPRGRRPRSGREPTDCRPRRVRTRPTGGGAAEAAGPEPSRAPPGRGEPGVAPPRRVWIGSPHLLSARTDDPTKAMRCDSFSRSFPSVSPPPCRECARRVDRRRHRQRDARLRRARPGVRRRDRWRHHVGRRAGRGQKRRRHGGHAGHGVPDRLDLQELHRTGRHAAGRGGQVDLDAEVSHYLEDFAGRPAGPVTIRQLLSHTSGFSTLQGNTRTRRPPPGRTSSRAVDASPSAPAYGPGERWEYSNPNYQILGRVIEVVSGQDYQAYVTANILEPVGMEHSFVADGKSTTRWRPGTPHGSAPGEHWPSTRPPRHGPPGGVVATAGDLARYLQMMMNGQDDVLSAAGKAQMMRPAGGAATFYGFGWFVDRATAPCGTRGRPRVSRPWRRCSRRRAGPWSSWSTAAAGSASGDDQLRNAVTAQALGLDYAGDGSRLPQKALFVGRCSCRCSTRWPWSGPGSTAPRSVTSHGRASPAGSACGSPCSPRWSRPGSSSSGAPPVGAPLDTIMVFQPDFGSALAASGATGVLWAVFRLTIAYTRCRRRTRPRPTTRSVAEAMQQPDTARRPADRSSASRRQPLAAERRRRRASATVELLDQPDAAPHQPQPVPGGERAQGDVDAPVDQEVPVATPVSSPARRPGPCWRDP